MRRAALRVRIWNEIRSLADLPSEDLAGVLDDAFELTSSVRGRRYQRRRTEGWLSRS